MLSCCNCGVRPAKTTNETYHTTPYLLLTLTACEVADHEHPFLDHEHPIAVHDHEDVISGVIDDLNTAYIIDIDPPVHGEDRIKYGRLAGDNYLEKDYITIRFSQAPHGLTVNDYPVELLLRRIERKAQ